jgi:hypothetical protein
VQQLSSSTVNLLRAVDNRTDLSHSELASTPEGAPETRLEQEQEGGGGGRLEQLSAGSPGRVDEEVGRPTSERGPVLSSAVQEEAVLRADSSTILEQRSAGQEQKPPHRLPHLSVTDLLISHVDVSCSAAFSELLALILVDKAPPCELKGEKEPGAEVKVKVELRRCGSGGGSFQWIPQHADTDSKRSSTHAQKSSSNTSLRHAVLNACKRLLADVASSEDASSSNSGGSGAGGDGGREVSGGDDRRLELCSRMLHIR